MRRNPLRSNPQSIPLPIAGNWLAGVELDFQRSNQAGNRTVVCPGVVCNPALAPADAPVTASMQQSLEWFSTLRARLGAVIDPDTVGYFTGGLALGRIKTSGAGNWLAGVELDFQRSNLTAHQVGRSLIRG